MPEWAKRVEVAQRTRPCEGDGIETWGEMDIPAGLSRRLVSSAASASGLTPEEPSRGGTPHLRNHGQEFGESAQFVVRRR